MQDERRVATAVHWRRRIAASGAWSGGRVASAGLNPGECKCPLPAVATGGSSRKFWRAEAGRRRRHAARIDQPRPLQSDPQGCSVGQVRIFRRNTVDAVACGCLRLLVVACCCCVRGADRRWRRPLRDADAEIQGGAHRRCSARLAGRAALADREWPAAARCSAVALHFLCSADAVALSTLCRLLQGCDFRSEAS